MDLRHVRRVGDRGRPAHAAEDAEPGLARSLRVRREPAAAGGHRGVVLVGADLAPVVEAVDGQRWARVAQRVGRQRRREGARVALLGLRQGGAQPHPARQAEDGLRPLRGEGDERVAPDVAARDRRAARLAAAARGGDRLAIGAGDEIVEHRADVAAVQGAGGRVPAPGGEAIEAVLVRARERVERPLRGDGVVEDPVEGHRADPLRVQLGVEAAELCAVRQAEEVELLVAQRAPQRLHVARHAQRVDMAEERPGAGQATLADRADVGLELRELVR